ncbi:hypothetical protein NP493_114g05045 [Ridgeia piscesae]|uniref:Uncharacterized protein n=1 Tax=Ridgeia piscesae TaxID=27915 RepID=A0AAD9P6V9_RIDPI|nr:hypothetical protein NP493_114g05045 [Ridgeia piscesae]
MPADMEATAAPPAARTAANSDTMWSSHMGLFVAIIILATICFIILIIGFMCIKYRSRRGSWSRKDDEAPIDPEPCGRKYPIVIENPIPDSEIMKGEAPMTESANPAMSYPVSKKDEDNGWVVPLDQLSPAERQKPDTENTKL